jgi:hypothetical protein
MEHEGAESIDDARHQWWVGLRDAEQEHYSKSGNNFERDEPLYRLGFEAALHAKHRGQEYDQVLSEMSADIETLKRSCPGVEAEEPFRRGFERGQEYLASLRKKSAA